MIINVDCPNLEEVDNYVDCKGISQAINRREFLKLNGSFVFSLLLPPLSQINNFNPDQLGRVAEAKIVLYEHPTKDSTEVNTYWRDMVFPITEVTIGEGEYNRIWYRIGDEGYAHSGGIQPVQARLNEAVHDIPENGVLAEVTVPFTDAYWGPGKKFPFAYRFYYETTYWITKKVQDARADPWYRVLDDKWGFYYFVPAKHLRLVPDDELSPLSTKTNPRHKRIEVRLSEQLVVAYENEIAVFTARAATGAKFSNGRYLTPLGEYKTFHKRPSRHMAAGDIASNGYDLPGVPWITYITEKGISFHGTYWHNDFGRPRSHGCINLTPSAAKWLYRWTVPTVPPDQQDVYEDFGTRVDVVE